MSSYVLELTPTAAKDIAKLSLLVRKRLATKLRYYMPQPDPLLFATKLTNLSKGGDYRFRVGDYRVVFDIRGVTKLTVLYVEHRREVYRKR